MRWDRSRASENVEDRRGQSGGGGMRLGGRSIGLGTVAIAVVAMLFGVDPSVVLNMAGGLNPPAAKQQAAPPPPAEDEAARFVSHVLGDTEDTWRTIFAKSGKTYEEPKLVLFSDWPRPQAVSASRLPDRSIVRVTTRSTSIWCSSRNWAPALVRRVTLPRPT